MFLWLQVGGSGDARSPPGHAGPVTVQIRGIPAAGIPQVQKHVKAACANFTVRFLQFIEMKVQGFVHTERPRK